MTDPYEATAEERAAEQEAARKAREAIARELDDSP